MLFLTLDSLAPLDPRVEGVELRLDLFDFIDLEKIAVYLKNISLPSLFTVRKHSQGGSLKSEEERLALIETLLSLKPTYIDLEYDVDPCFIKKIHQKFPHTKIILSYHDFEKTPDSLSTLLEKIFSPYASFYKIATYANSTLDALRMLLFVRGHKNLIGLCMGAKGEISRVLAPVFGSFLNYAAPSLEKKIGGQLTLDELFSIYNYGSLGPSTKLFGLIGDPVDHSIGYLTHNALMKFHKLPAVYVRMLVKKEEISEFLHLALQCPFSGLSVTTPLKELFSLESVNTLHHVQESFKEYTTDGEGALNALEKKIPVKGKKIALLGCGGAAKAIANVAKKRGAELFIFNRDKDKALALAYKVGAVGEALSNFSGEYALIINATTHPLPIDPSLLSSETFLMEVKTVPKKSLFLEGRDQCIYGYEMFLEQAALQFKIWFDLEIDKNFLEKECLMWV